MQNEKTFSFLIGNTYMYLKLNNISFDMKKWYRTKDLHPKFYVIQMLLDLIESKKFYFNGVGTTKLVMINIPYTNELAEIDKVKNDSNLYNILIHEYFNSAKGFSYIMENIENKIKDQDFIKTTFDEF